MSESRNQFAATLLLVLTVVAIIGSILSLLHLRSYPLPYDGVTWVDQASGSGQPQVLAAFISPGGPGEKAGIRVGDQLERIQALPIRRSLDVPEALWTIPLLGQAQYTLRRDGIEFQKDHIFIQAAPRDSALYYQYCVGFFYLAIGLFVYFRRTSAAKSLHFFLLCLISFIGSCFHYSGKLNTFDEIMYWGNLSAGLIAPTVFLHFCLTFYGRPRWLERRGRWLLMYIPALTMIVLVAA